MTGVGEPIKLPGGARALFTDRSQGNLSSVGGPRTGEALSAREAIRRRCGAQVLARGFQVHGTTVARVYRDGSRSPSVRRADAEPSEPNRARPNGAAGADGRDPDVRTLVDGVEQPRLLADGHAVAAPGVAAMVMAADCLPVVLAAPGAVAALHAGWRGLAAGVLEQGVLALREVGADGPIVAIVGPCAGACCYEVGAEVHAAFSGADLEQGAAAGGSSADRGAPIDLRMIAHQRLRQAGVAEVGDVGACTICDERFFSFRREGPGAGRQAGIAWLT